MLFAGRPRAIDQSRSSGRRQRQGNALRRNPQLVFTFGDAPGHDQKPRVAILLSHGLLGDDDLATDVIVTIGRGPTHDAPRGALFLNLAVLPATFKAFEGFGPERIPPLAAPQAHLLRQRMRGVAGEPAFHTGNNLNHALARNAMLGGDLLGNLAFEPNLFIDGAIARAWLPWRPALLLCHECLGWSVNYPCHKTFTLAEK